MNGQKFHAFGEILYSKAPSKGP